MSRGQRVLTVVDLQALKNLHLEDADLEHLTDNGLSDLWKLTDQGFDTLIHYLRATDGHRLAVYTDTTSKTTSVRGAGIP